MENYTQKEKVKNMFDLVLKNGLVCDPANAVYSVLNVGVKDGKIAALSDQPLEGKDVRDCTGYIVTPGFVDSHLHEDELDGETLTPEITLRALRMGVTTFVGGQCGSSQRDLELYRKAYDGKQPVNVALLSGHGTIRRMVGAKDKYAPVTPEQVQQMCEILEQQLASGLSHGLSMGIRYIPGMAMDEMCAMAAVVKKYNGVLAAHVRDDAVTGIEPFKEFIEIGRRSGCRLQVSHLGSMAAYGLMEEVLSYLDACAAEGMDIWIDCYPYNAFSTSIGATTYDEGFLQRYGNDVSKIEMTDGEFKGRRIPDLETFHRLRREHPEYLTVGHVMDSAEVERALLHPRTMVGSDGILLNGAGHPRAAGSFPRFLRMYALERNLLSMPEAVAKVTCMAAKRFGLNKGTLSVGADADVTVFDPKTLTDNATFQEPGLAPTGIQLVLLNGMPVLENGEILCADQGYMITR